MKKGLLAIAAVLAATALVPAAASANTITVDTTDDEQNAIEPCSLREAIDNANSDVAIPTNGCDAGSGDDIINFDATEFPLGGAPETIELDAGGALSIMSNIDFFAPGFAEIAVAASPMLVPDQPILSVDQNRIVNVTGLTFTGVDTMLNGGILGGAIVNSGDLTLNQVLVIDNEITATANGVGADAYGAGIYNAMTGDLELNFSLVTDNFARADNFDGDGIGATARGGGIYNLGDLGIHNSTIETNHVDAEDDGTSIALAEGGGVRSNSSSTFTADHSSFIGNTADAENEDFRAYTRGAGIDSQTATQLELVTIALNNTDADAPDLTIESGAGVSQDAATTMSIRSSTIAENGPESAAAIAGSNVLAVSGTILLANTIVSNPLGGGDNCIGPGTINSNGYIVDFSAAGPSCDDAVPGTGDLYSDPMLDLTNGPVLNGGSTENYRLLTGSPAIDSGDDMFQTIDPDHDQRGLARPHDFLSILNLGPDGTDRGSVEEQFVSPTTPPGGSGTNPPAATPTGRRAAALKKCKKKKGAARKKCKKKANKLPV